MATGSCYPEGPSVATAKMLPDAGESEEDYRRKYIPE